MKPSTIASTAFLSQALRVISGPITIILVARTLSSEEMSFYYSFFNVMALQQILEMGLGFVIKQYIAHDYRNDLNNNWLPDSVASIRSYFIFSCLWFLIISLFVLVVVGLFGGWFFSSYQGDISWQNQWWAMVVVTALTTTLTPIQFLLEGCQQQLSLYKARLLSALVSALILCVSLYLGAGLYSVAISLLFSNLILYACVYRESRKLLMELLAVKSSRNLRDIIAEIWPMLSKISVTWVMGYFFWNSFNLIAFKTLPIELAGRLGFTLSLARAGLSIAESLVASQTTIYASYISSGRVSLAKVQFEKLLIISCMILLSGFVAYILLGMFFPKLIIFYKALDLCESVWIFIYFALLLPVLSQASFCRCFKKEPYFKLSLFVNIQVPIVFFIICYVSKEPLFKYLIPFSLLSLFWSNTIYKNETIGSTDKE